MLGTSIGHHIVGLIHGAKPEVVIIPIEAEPIVVTMDYHTQKVVDTPEKVGEPKDEVKQARRRVTREIGPKGKAEPVAKIIKKAEPEPPPAFAPVMPKDAERIVSKSPSSPVDATLAGTLASRASKGGRRSSTGSHARGCGLAIGGREASVAASASPVTRCQARNTFCT